MAAPSSAESPRPLSSSFSSSSRDRELLRQILAQVVEQGPGGVVLTDSQGVIEYVNGAYTAMTGFVLEDLRGQKSLGLLAEANAPRVYADLRGALTGGSPWAGEYLNRRKDGTSFWVQASVSPIKDPSGRVVRYVGQMIDITDRKVAEEVARTQHGFQVFLSRITSQLVQVREPESLATLREVFRELGELFRADRVTMGFLSGGGQILNQRVFWDREGRSVPLSIDLGPDQAVWKLIFEGEGFFDVSGPSKLAVPIRGGLGDPGWLALEADGPRPFWGEEICVSILVVANTLSAFLKRVIDEMKLVEARREADLANQAKTDFLASMSHEIRTPMNGILGLAELALSKAPPPEVRGYLEGIRASGESLMSLVTEILDISKIEAGKLELESVGFSLGHLMDSTLGPFRVLAAKKGLSLTLDVLAADHRRGDPARIRQIVSNLVGNALKFTPAGQISVSVRPVEGDPEVLLFAVRDTGPGVRAESRHRLFRSFSQAEASTARKYRGSGLGLSISKELAEKMGGAIGYEDAEDPSGALFWFTARVPPVDSGPAEKPAVAVDGLRPSFGHLRVLVAEDNQVNQQVAAGLLRNEGVEPVLASNGVEALSLIAESPFDLVLMDVQMPLVDGLTATRMIRKGDAGDRNRSVRIVAMTANAVDADRAEALAAGMDGYLTKPISTAKVRALLEHWGRSRVRRTFDAAEMGRRLDLDEEFLKQIVRMFWEGLPARRDLLVQAWQTDRLDDLKKAAHTLKGTAANLVADDVVEASQALETAIGEGREASYQPCFDLLIEEIDRLGPVLDQYLKS